MKHPSAISSRLSTTASRKAATRVRKLWSLLAISTVLMLSTAADNSSDARYNDLGHRMICTCDSAPAAMGPRGCRQVLLECSHVNCDTSGRMRGELKAALQKGDKDEVILQSFVQKYGATVLVGPSMWDDNIINRLARIVPFAVLAATASIGIAFIVRRRRRAQRIVTRPLAELQDIDMDALRRRVQEETENDDWE